MSETLATWSEVEVEPFYQELSTENKLKALYEWEDLNYPYISKSTPDRMRNFRLGFYEKEARIKFPELPDDEIRDVIEGRIVNTEKDFLAGIQRTKSRDARFNSLKAGRSLYRNEEIVLNDAEKKWMDDNDIDNSFDTSWMVRKGLDEKDPEATEINYAVAAFGKDEFTNRILSNDLLTDGQKHKAIANFDKYNSHAVDDFVGYINSKRLDTYGVEFQADEEDEVLNVKYNPMFSTAERIKAIREQKEDYKPSEEVINNLITRWASKRGLGGVSDISPELREKLADFYTDGLLYNKETWGDEAVKKDSFGDFVVNPNYVNNYFSTGDIISDEDVRNKLKTQNVPEVTIEGFLNQKQQQENQIASTLIDQIYKLAPTEVSESKGIVGAVTDLTKFVNFVEANKKEGLEPREIIEKYKQDHKGNYISNIAAPLFGGAVLAGSQVARNIQGTALSLAGVDYGDELIETKATFDEGIQLLDNLRGSTSKYARMIGEEVGLLLKTGGASALVRRATPWFRANRVKANHKNIADRLNKLAANIEVGDTLQNASNLKKFTDRLAFEGYAGLQTSRALTNFYSNSYLTTKNELIEAGVDESEAKQIARDGSIMPSMLAGAVTYGLMKVFPDGAEAFFSKANNQLTKTELAAALQVNKNDLGKLLSNPTFKKEVSNFLTEELGWKRLLKGGLVRTSKGALIGGGREAIEEGSAEFLEGLIEMWTFNEDLTLVEAAKGAGVGAAIGGILGLGVGGLRSYKNNTVNNPVINYRVNRLRTLADSIQGNNPRTAAVLTERADKIEQDTLVEQDQTSEVEEASEEASDLDLQREFITNDLYNLSTDASNISDDLSPEDRLAEAEELYKRINAVVQEKLPERLHKQNLFHARDIITKQAQVGNEMFARSDAEMLDNLFTEINSDLDLDSAEAQDLVRFKNDDIKRASYKSRKSILRRLRNIADSDPSEESEKLITGFEASLRALEAAAAINTYTGVETNPKVYANIFKSLNRWLENFQAVNEAFANNEITIPDLLNEVRGKGKASIPQLYGLANSQFKKAVNLYTDNGKNADKLSAIQRELYIYNLKDFFKPDAAFQLPSYKDLEITSVSDDPGVADVMVRPVLNAVAGSPALADAKSKYEAGVIEESQLRDVSRGLVADYIGREGVNLSEAEQEYASDLMLSDTFISAGEDATTNLSEPNAINLVAEQFIEHLKDVYPNQDLNQLDANQLVEAYDTFALVGQNVGRLMSQVIPAAGYPNFIEDLKNLAKQPSPRNFAPTETEDVDTGDEIEAFDVEGDIVDNEPSNVEGDLVKIFNRANDFLENGDISGGATYLDNQLNSGVLKGLNIDLISPTEGTEESLRQDVNAILRYNNENKNTEIVETKKFPTYQISNKLTTSLDDHIKPFIKNGVYLTKSSFIKKGQASPRNLSKDERKALKEANQTIAELYPIKEVDNPQDLKVNMHRGVRDTVQGVKNYAQLLDKKALYTFHSVEDSEGNFVFTNNPYSVAKWLSTNKKESGKNTELNDPIKLPKEYTTKEGKRLLNKAFTLSKDGTEIIGVKINMPPGKEASNFAEVEAGNRGKILSAFSEYNKVKSTKPSDKRKEKKGISDELASELGFASDFEGVKSDPKKENTFVDDELRTFFKGAVNPDVFKEGNVVGKNIIKFLSEQVSEIDSLEVIPTLLRSIFKTRLANSIPTTIKNDQAGIDVVNKVWDAWLNGLTTLNYGSRDKLIPLGYKNEFKKLIENSAGFVEGQGPAQLIFGNPKETKAYFLGDSVPEKIILDSKYNKSYKDIDHFKQLFSNRPTNSVEDALTGAADIADINENNILSQSKADTKIPFISNKNVSSAVLRKAAALVKAELDELGVKDNNPETLRDALQLIVIGAQEGKYGEQYGNVASLLLNSGLLDTDNITLRVGEIEEGVSGYYTETPTGKVIAISDSVSNGKGAHDLVIHEVLHSVLDNLVTNPRNSDQLLAVTALDTLIDKGREYFESLTENRLGAAKRANLQAAKEAETFKTSYLKSYIENSDSPFKEGFTENPTDVQLQNMYVLIRRDELKYSSYGNDIVQLSHAFGINEDNSFLDPQTSRKEFITHLLTDPTLHWYLKEIGKLESRGSLWNRMTRALSKGLGIENDDTQGLILQAFIGNLDGGENYVDHSTMKGLQEIAGVSIQDLYNAASYVENTPAFTGQPLEFSENAEQFEYVNKLGNDSVIRNAAAAFNVEIIPVEEFDTPVITGRLQVQVPSEINEDTERSVMSKILASAYAEAFPPGYRKDVIASFKDRDPQIVDKFEVLAEEAGSFEELIGDALVDGYFESDYANLNYNVPLQDIRNTILLGNFGQRMASQMDTMVKAADSVLPERSYVADSFIADKNVDRRLIASKAARELDLKVSPDAYVEFTKESIDTKVPFANLIRDSVDDETTIEELEKIREYHLDQLETYSNSVLSDSRIAAAHEKMQLGELPARSYSKASTALDLTEEDRQSKKIIPSSWRPALTKFKSLIVAKKDPERDFADEGNTVDEILDFLEVASIPKVGRSVFDVIPQGFTVSGRGGAKFQRLVTELQNKLSGTRARLLGYRTAIPKLTKDLTGSTFENLLESDWSYEVSSEQSTEPHWLETNILNGVKSYTAQDLYNDINDILGSTEDDVLIDDYLNNSPTAPFKAANRENLQDQKLREIGVHLSIYGKKMSKAKKLRQDNQLKQASVLEQEALSAKNTRVEAIKEKYSTLEVQLYTEAANFFRIKQEKAINRLRDLEDSFLDESSLENSILENILSLRKDVDNLSGVVQNSEILSRSVGKSNSIKLANLTIKMGAGNQIYLTRSYKGLETSAYDYWLSTFDEEAQKRYQSGFDYMHKQMAKEMADSWIASHPEMSAEEFKRDAFKKLSKEPEKIHERLKDTLKSFQRTKGANSSLGISNPKILLPRTDLPKELRFFAGSYQDNVYNAGRTLMSLSTLVANEEFLNNVKALLEETSKETGAVAITKDEKIAAENGLRKFHTDDGFITKENLGPLADYYGPKNIIDAINALRRPKYGELAKFMAGVSAYTMANLTSRRPRTHARNFVGNTLFLTASGMPLTAISTVLGSAFSPVARATKLNKVPVIKNFVGRRAGGQALRDAAFSAFAGDDKVNSWMRDTFISDEGPAFTGEETRNLREEYASIGISGQDVFTNLRRELLNSKDESVVFDALSRFGLMGGPLATKVTDSAYYLENVASQFYSAEDDFWKITMYEGQLTKLASVFGITGKDIDSDVEFAPLQLRSMLDGISESTADKILRTFKPLTNTQRELASVDKKAAAILMLKTAAADRVKASMPFYSNTLAIVKALKRSGAGTFVAPFISFSSEVLRIAVDVPILAASEIRLGSKLAQDHPDLVDVGKRLNSMGLQRLTSNIFTMVAGASSVALTFTLVSALVKKAEEALSGEDLEDEDLLAAALKEFVSPDKESALKRFLSEWYSRGHVAVLDIDRDDKKVTWADISHLIPQSDITGPITRVLRSLPLGPASDFFGTSDESFFKAVRGGFGDLFGPYFSRQIWVEALLGSGSQESILTGLEQGLITTKDIETISRIKDAFVPGVIPDIKKVVDALIKKESVVGGRKITPVQEAMSAFLGQKIITTDLPDRFERKLAFRNAQIRETKRILSKALQGGSTQSISDIEKATETMLKRQEEAIRQIYNDFKGASLLMTERDATKIIKNSNLSNEVQRMVLRGYYRPMKPSKSLIERGYKQDKKLGTEGNTRAALNLIRKQKVKLFDE